MDMITVGYVILIRNALNNAKALLQTLGKLISGRLHRCSVYGIANVLSFSPLGTFIIQMLHHTEGEFFPFFRRMAGTYHPVAHFTQSGISKRDRGITIV